eukprot:COSAG02_NODE_11228_length_1766_cov_10.346131_1_plen_131_part_10
MAARQQEDGVCTTPPTSPEEDCGATGATTEPAKQTPLRGLRGLAAETQLVDQSFPKEDSRRQKDRAARQVDTFVERDQPADGTRAGEQLASKTRGLRGLAARVPQSVRKQQQQSGSDCPSPMREKESHWAR